MKIYTPLIGALLVSSTSVWADNSESSTQRLERLEKQIAALQKKDKEEKQATSSLTPNIKIGGAVRAQYSYHDGNEGHGGDLDFDVFRLNLDGTIGDIKLSAEYRWYQYMRVVHHAEIGYQFNDNWDVKAGITKVPFGNLGYNSNSFFFSDGFYTGLEDDYDAGLSFTGKYGNHDIRVAYFVNDELGGVDAYISNKADRYSFDVVGVRNFDAGEGIYSEPGEAMGESNTLNLRYAYTFDNEFAKTEIGGSYLAGELEGSDGSLGNRTAYAIHAKSNIDNIAVMFQYTQYDYDLDNGDDFVAIGAYSYFDSMPTEAALYNVNVSYSKDVSLGPVNNLTFYNDYNVMTDKSGGLKEDTIMNVTGVAVTAGPIYAWVDYVVAKNQPFMSGTLAGDSDEWFQRLNINFGYYF